MRRVPDLTLLETGLPVAALHDLARREGNAKKPIFEMHKWWARRLGSVFRALLIAATSPGKKRELESAKARRLLMRFYQRGRLSGLVVLDPFMGGGTSVVEALKQGATVVGVDVDPVAWFVTKKQVEECPADRIRRAYHRISETLEGELRALYRTYDPVRRRFGEIVNAFWVIRLKCGSCRRAFDAHPHYRLAYDEERRRQEVVCARCGAIHSLHLSRKRFKCRCCSAVTEVENGPVGNGKYICPHCAHSGSLRQATSDGKPHSKRLFAVEYTVPGITDERTGKARRLLKSASRADVIRYAQASRALHLGERRLPYPRGAIFRKGRYDRRPISFGFSHYWQLFSDRQLYCLSRIYQAIGRLEDKVARDYVFLAFSDSLAANNQLVGYAFGYRKATPLFGIHGYHVVQRPVEGNVWGNPHFGRASFSRCVAKVCLGKEYAGAPYEFAYARKGNPVRVYLGETCEAKVSSNPRKWRSTRARALLLNRSSSSLSPIKDQTVDLVLTDPPFYDNLPYSELSDFYFQWLRRYLPKQEGRSWCNPALRDSLFVRRKNVVEHTRYVEGLSSVMRECARVLRPKGLMVFTFHHREPAAWHALGRSLADAGFYVTAVSPVLAEGVSGFHSYEGTPKWDAVVCCRLTRLSERSGSSAGLTGRVLAAEAAWRKRTANSLPLSRADRASIAYSFALKAAVNGRLSDVEFAHILRQVAAARRVKGVAASVPGVGAVSRDVRLAG